MSRRYTDKDRLQELRKELYFRHRVYPRRVDEGKMTQAESDRRIGILEEMAQELEEVVKRTTPTLFDQKKP